MKNMLLEPVEYKIEETAFGVWRSFLYPNGQLYRDFTSHSCILGLPLLQYARGICPETGRHTTATGVIAVGTSARGILAIGKRSWGLIAVGQFAWGLLLGLGQICCGTVAVGQLAVGVFFGLGQLTTGYIAIGQLALGGYVLAQGGFGPYVWDHSSPSPQAHEFFRRVLSWLRPVQPV